MQILSVGREPDPGQPAAIRCAASIFGARRSATRRGASIRDLAIKVPDPGIEVSSLSGGNQQKVVIGKALMTEPKVLLMDEPSRGIDVGAKAEVFRTMRKLAAEGLGIMFVTSDLEEVMALSDRIAVMSNGRLTGAVRPRRRRPRTASSRRRPPGTARIAALRRRRAHDRQSEQRRPGPERRRRLRAAC